MGRSKHHGMGWHRIQRETWSSYLPEYWPGERQWSNIDQVLRRHVVPHFARHQNKTFQQDNARAHTARVTGDFLQQNNVNVMNWPALSPDLNPIEHLWDEIQRRLNEEQPSPTTAVELSLVFQRVWACIPITFINRLVNSMYRRCAAVINAGGGHTRY